MDKQASDPLRMRPLILVPCSKRKRIKGHLCYRGRTPIWFGDGGVWKMIYRKWSLMTMPIALVGVSGAVALGGAFIVKDKAVAYVQQFRRDGEMLRQQDKARIAANGA